MPSEAARNLAPQDWMTEEATRAVIAALGANGSPVRFVGGCVRDAVLGRPVSDIDIATPDPPETAISLLQRAGIRVVPTGIDHGTVTAVTKARNFEITTLRHDVETFGRHARVAFTDDWDADAARRDFTMNAMSCTPEGDLHDPFGGYDDAVAGRVRFVGDPRKRIEEDVLRLLRFYRFNAHYGRGALDEEGRAACRDMAERIPALSVERVRDELLKLLSADESAAMIAIMTEDGILARVLPEATMIDRLRRMVPLEAHHAAPDPVRRLAALLDCDDDTAEEVAARLRLSNAEIRRIAYALGFLRYFDPALGDHGWRVAVYRNSAQVVRDACLIYWAGREEVDDTALGRALEQTDNWTTPEFPVGGDDARRLGVSPGPGMGAVLRAVEDWWVAGDFSARREDALEELRRQVEAGTGADR